MSEFILTCIYIYICNFVNTILGGFAFPKAHINLYEIEESSSILVKLLKPQMFCVLEIKAPTLHKLYVLRSKLGSHINFMFFRSKLQPCINFLFMRSKLGSHINFMFFRSKLQPCINFLFMRSKLGSHISFVFLKPCGAIIMFLKSFIYV
jgi:hypothetical protein